MRAQRTAGGSPPPGSSPNPSAAAIFGSFLRLGVTAFGGPAMIAHIREMSVKRNKWLTEETFKNGVVICQSVPGATAMQMAAYVGLRMRGVRGAVASYAGFGLPAFLLMLTLAVFYSGSREMPLVVSLFRGLQVMVVAIVANATFTFGRDIGKKPLNLVLAGRRRRTVRARRESVRGHRRRGDRRGPDVQGSGDPSAFRQERRGMPGMCPGRSSFS